MFQLATPRCCPDVRLIGVPPSTTVASGQNWIYEMGPFRALLRKGRRGLLPDSRRLPANSLHHTPKSWSRKGPDAFRPKAAMSVLLGRHRRPRCKMAGLVIFRWGQEQHSSCCRTMT